MPSKAERDAAFKRMDYNGNGVVTPTQQSAAACAFYSLFFRVVACALQLSLAEIDKAVLGIWPQFNHKPALMRAYKAADRDVSEA